MRRGNRARYLSQRLPISAAGITISQSQATRARYLNQLEGLSSIQIDCADFTVKNLRQSDWMYAIESLVHASKLETVLMNVSNSLSPGGHLVVCDDFLSRPFGALTDENRDTIDCLMSGWRIPSLTTWEHFNSISESCGLSCIESQDWTRFVRTDRLRESFLHC